MIGLVWDEETREEVAEAAETASTVEEDLTHVMALSGGELSKDTVTEGISAHGVDEDTMDEDAMTTMLDGKL